MSLLIITLIVAFATMFVSGIAFEHKDYGWSSLLAMGSTSMLILSIIKIGVMLG